MATASRTATGLRSCPARGRRSAQLQGGGDRDRKPYGGGDNRKPFGNREDRPARGFDRGDAGPRQYGRTAPRTGPCACRTPAISAAPTVPDRERSPQIDEDVTGKELDRATQHQIKTLEGTSAEWVARHLVMAGRLLDEEPELAFQHALAASRRGGRLASVREAVGLTAYAAGHYGEALREFRTYRRISGSNMHLPVMADCERGLGRPDRALDMARSEEAKDLDAPGKVELAIVAAGARTDLGQLDAAVSELEIPQLDINRAFSYSPRLFRAYADALTAAGRAAEAGKRQAAGRRRRKRAWPRAKKRNRTSSTSAGTRKKKPARKNGSAGLRAQIRGDTPTRTPEPKSAHRVRPVPPPRQKPPAPQPEWPA